MKQLLLHFILFITLIGFSLIAFYFLGKDIWYPYYKKCYIERNVEPIVPQECNKTHLDENNSIPIIEIIEKNSTQIPTMKSMPTPIHEKISSERRLKRLLADSNFIIYPKKLTIIGLKYEQTLEVWGEINKKQTHIGSYPFTAFSGVLGPKFQEGDRQIPEGIYGIGYLNPNSKYHLSMQINYPNAFDKAMAKKEKRTNLGSAIMIHGKAVTIGCIPIGDQNIEELYFLVEQVGIRNTKVILAPVDFRRTSVKITSNRHPWLKELYANITKEMQPFISK